MFKGLNPMLMKMLMGGKMPFGSDSTSGMGKMSEVQNPFSMLSSMPWGMNQAGSMGKPSGPMAEIISIEAPTSGPEKEKKKEGKGKRCVTKCVAAGKCQNNDLMKIAMIIAPESCKSCMKNKCENLTTGTRKYYYFSSAFFHLVFYI